MFFLFQAEDGIRDGHVTGVQTCALPICQSAQNFWPSTKRLIREIGPERKFLAIAILIGTVSVALSVIGPRILGRATDIIFTGLISRDLPEGTDPADVIAQLRAAGEDQVGGLRSGKELTPRPGLDFTALHPVP